MKTYLILITIIFSGVFVSAQKLAIPNLQQRTSQRITTSHEHHDHENHNHDHTLTEDHDLITRSVPTGGISFIQNKGQWPEQVTYKTTMDGINSLFLEKGGFTYVFTHPEDVEKIHDVSSGLSDDVIRKHAYQVNFLNANLTSFQEEGKHREYHNYILGNDPSKWASKVPLYNKVTYEDLYDGVDLAAYSDNGRFKYDFIINPGADPDKIRLDYHGMDALEIDNSNLIIHTSVELVVEQAPYAYQIINGKETRVPCEYEIEGNTVSFVFPSGYAADQTLIIDPTVIASTLSGTIGEGNFGHTATFDNEGNMYAGGRSFGLGYPTTFGAFQVNFEGGETDIAVTKYTPDGTAQIYATYIGGSANDYPHSMVTDFYGQLYILGTSNSNNFPVTSNAFQDQKGSFIDIIIVKLTADGSALVGSTFMGGSGTDGENNSTLNSNYDDRFRGEIVLDNQGNAYIASCTSSADFPTSDNAYDKTLGIGPTSLNQDGVVFKLNSDLSTLFFSTYLGSSDPDAAFGIRVDDFGVVYVTGFVGESDFPTTPGTVQPNWAGGTEEAFVTIFNPTGSGIIASTFWGTSSDEHSFFLDIDEDNNIHIYGQTLGPMAVTPGVYTGAPQSHQFITAFTSRLESVVYSTVVGTGSSVTYDFTPVAFMVDKCNNIYFSGYCFESNTSLPVTPDAISTTTGTFYLGVLDPLATNLQFASYYGNANHVDGGTSRFDKSGTVYQGVCSCTTSGILNTTPGAYAENQLPFCDIGVFKIDFDVPTVTAASIALPTNSGCAPFDVNFLYTGQDATAFEWDFGDGSPLNNSMNTSHTFTDPGEYTVRLVASNQITCNTIDTSYLVISVLAAASTLSETSVCTEDETIFLDATTTNATYLWNNGTTNATLVANGPGVYWADVSLFNGLCTRRDSFVVTLNNSLGLDLGEDISVCDENTYAIDGTTPGAASYLWNTGSGDPVININSSGIYSITITDSDGCADTDNIEVIFSTTPTVDLGPDTTLCDLTTLALSADLPGTTSTWSDGSVGDIFTVSDPGVYWVQVDNDGCFGYDTIQVDYYAEVFLDIQASELVCFGDCDGSIVVDASGGNGPFTYLWSTGSDQPTIEDLCAGNYILTITDDLCNYVLTDVFVTEPPLINYDIEINDVQCFGDGDGQISFTNITGGTPPFLFSLNGAPFEGSPAISNLNGGIYEVEIMDANGCSFSETVSIYEPPEILVDAGPDHVIELGETVQLEGIVTPTANQNIRWSPADSLDCNDCIQPIAHPINTTLYTLTVIDSITGCTITDEALVRVEKNRNVFIPNVFSPDGDGVNDLFTIFTGNGVRRILEFRIFDRWGAVQYEADNIEADNHTFGWDGTFKGEPKNTGVFVYYAEIEFIDDFVILYKGDITLVR
jgi:gliding motility-associated-like protein